MLMHTIWHTRKTDMSMRDTPPCQQFCWVSPAYTETKAPQSHSNRDNAVAAMAPIPMMYLIYIFMHIFNVSIYGTNNIVLARNGNNEDRTMIFLSISVFHSFCNLFRPHDTRTTTGGVFPKLTETLNSCLCWTRCVHIMRLCREPVFNWVCARSAQYVHYAQIVAIVLLGSVGEFVKKKRDSIIKRYKKYNLQFTTFYTGQLFHQNAFPFMLCPAEKLWFCLGQRVKESTKQATASMNFELCLTLWGIFQRWWWWKHTELNNKIIILLILPKSLARLFWGP